MSLFSREIKVKSEKSVIRRTPDGSVTYVKTLQKRRSTKELDKFRQELSFDDHIISLRDLLNKYSTHLRSGLSKGKACELLKVNGPNALVSPPTKSKWIIFAEYLFGGFSLLLWGGAILTLTSFTISYLYNGKFLQDQLYLACTLIAVVFITGIFGFVQETRNASIMDSFKNMVPKYANVIRDGQKASILCEEIVVGDLVEIKLGDCVPADIRVTECTGLKVDNSSITGESEPQTRSTECTDSNPLETANLAFFGTNVVEGSGKGIVVACGDNTLMGHIAGLTSNLEAEDTPIKIEMSRFIKIITILSVIIGVVFFIISLCFGYSFIDAFIFLIAIIVANVPEGLSVTLTACLTLTAKRMKKKHCLVKNLQAVETLGSTNVICSDKTGTLTQNSMTVSHIYFDNYIMDVLGRNKFMKGEAFNALCRVAVLCSRAEFKPNQEDVEIEKRECVGDASEIAVLKFMEIIEGGVARLRNENTKVLEIPFNSTNKYQISVHELRGENRHLLVMKGAPERILDRCGTIILDKTELPLTPERKKVVQMAVQELCYLGERVLAFADLFLPKEKYPIGYVFNAEEPNYPTTNLRFVGLMSMIDPPRESVPSAVEKCRTAGIKVVMVTGDHPMTAMAIARKVGIISPNNETAYDIAMVQNVSTTALIEEDINRCRAAVVTGNEIRDISQDQLIQIITRYDEIAFARTSPQQKLKIVEAFQKLGAVVAVTGDGVNDSPALKKADIGIAMGISGSDVSKEAADMVLLDDNFSSIVTGVEEGRLIFDNLKKSIFYVLTSNVPEIVPFLAFVIVGLPQALSMLCILIIDTGTDLWPAISLAYEQSEADIMLRMPRNPHTDTLVNSRLIWMTYGQIGLIQSLASFSCYFFLMGHYGFFWERLIGIRHDWYEKHINNLQDSYGQEWDYEERMSLNRKCYACYFLSIVITQVADLMICKTRKLSVFHQGMYNWVLNFAILFEIFLAIVVVYVPGLNTALQMEPLDPIFLLPALPFALFIIIYDEIRRLMIRIFTGGWMERETYY